MSALLHTTREGERWDAIAWHYYRDVREMARLIAANPHAPRSGRLPSGLTLAIPLIGRPLAVSTAGLPPWKR
ncbi:tail protein X [Thiobacter aerophilum]|uniref:Tail protein X n=1 Tax=Thiobacter aerophilum TaxID=3121275 RepID=A0ABV0EE32_9BURK